MKRRTVLKTLACGACASLLPINPLRQGGGLIENALCLDTIDTLSDVEAMFYEKREGTAIECVLCPRHCRVTDLERGYCGVRENRAGTYISLVHSRACAMNIDPIEKKPLFHFKPGTPAFSIATAGCNVNCQFCQNWDISQVRPEQVTNVELTPEDISRICRERSIPTVAYTYSEPVVFYEYMHDTCLMSREHGIKNVVITGGYIEKKPLTKLLGLVDAVKVDLKAFSEDYYREIVNGELQPVLEALKIISQEGVWLELVYLMVPTLNDSEEELKHLCGWILENLGDRVPIHFTRFHPAYLMKNLPSTPVESLEKAYTIASRAGMKYPYVGNVFGHEGEHTHCPNCSRIVIRRRGFSILENNLLHGRCKYCNHHLDGVWS